MRVPRHFAHYLSDFQPSRIREDVSMHSMPICPNCFHAMVIEWKLNIDGDKISRATCHDCNEVKPITASVAPKDANGNGVPSQTNLGASVAPRSFSPVV